MRGDGQVSGDDNREAGLDSPQEVGNRDGHVPGLACETPHRQFGQVPDELGRQCRHQGLR